MEHTHVFLQKNALTAVNINLSLRNWLIGFYIVEFEQKGSDRAVYGERLLEKMSLNLKHIKGMSPRNLLSFRLFYNTYPHVSVLFTQKSEIQSQQLKYLINGISSFIESKNQISQSATAKFQTSEKQTNTPIELLITSLSFTHLVEIIKLAEPLKRTFYEIEAIKGTWSVKELQRQIDTLLYEHTGLSKNKAELINLTNKNAETQTIENAIRSPYFFEFLGLKDTILNSHS